MSTSFRDIGDYLETQLRAKGRNAVMNYGDLIKAFDDLPNLTDAWLSHPLCKFFEELDMEDASLNRPFRTALVVSKEEMTPGAGFFKMYVQHRDKKARIRSEEDRIMVHLKELNALHTYYYQQQPK